MRVMAGSADVDVALREAGEAIYRNGVRQDGSALRAIVRSDVNVTAQRFACASCHRRSGLGTSEGRVRTPPIAGPQLFSERAAPIARPAYDDDSLRIALTRGIGADGRMLDPLMPRYDVRAGDVRALSAYLRILGSEPAPGVSEEAIRLVTIVSDSTPPQRRAALLQVIERYVENKNAGSRRESARAAAAKRHAFGERRDRAFRRWTWMVWELRGPETRWPEQLEALYADAAPFAVLSGSTGDSWAVVSEFCEQKSLPCVLPLAEVTGRGDADFYSLYFSASAELEARVAALDFERNPPSRSNRLLLVHTDDARGHAAARSWRAGLAPSDSRSLSVRVIPSAHVVSAAEWQGLLARERPDVLMAWLPEAALAALANPNAAPDFQPLRVYTLASLSDWAGIELPHALREAVRHIYPYRLPQSGRSQFPREQVWLQRQGLGGLHRETAVRALFACHALGEGLADIGANFSQDYLLESLEHVLDGTEMNTIFPHTSLGPGQRYLSRGAYVAELSPNGATDPFVRAVWLQR